MWPFKRKPKEVRLTDEERAAVDREWRLFISAMPKEDGPGEWYAPKEIVDAMRKTIASDALLTLADRYLMETTGSLANKAEQTRLYEKAGAAAIKAVAIDAHPLNYYKAGNILEVVNKPEDARLLFKEFLRAAPQLLQESEGNFKTVVQNALDDMSARQISRE